MELSRRGMLGGFAAVGAIGVAGFAGAASVTDSEDDEEPESAPVDPDAPFEARLYDTNDGDDEGVRLFDANDLDRVERVQPSIAEGDENRVYVTLGDESIDGFQTILDAAGATDDPARFVVSMTLNGTEVRRVDLDEAMVDALTDPQWGGLLTLPFDDEGVAEDVYESLAKS